MKLPNADQAEIDIRKLTEYALDPEDPRGRHKARVFKAALGYTAANADDLRTKILASVQAAECRIGELDFYGQRYTVDCRIETETGEATVRTGWIVRQSETFPRLTTCFVLKERPADESENRTS